jgi:hypothetical protein
MAIFVGGTAIDTPQVQAGMNFTKGAQGQGVVNQSNNNRKVAKSTSRPRSDSVSAGFTTLDAIIRNLDALYELLPDV